MATACLAPIFDLGAQFFNNLGGVLAGGKIQVYLAGTTTATDTWTDSGLTVKNSNPIPLTSAGRLSNPVWLQSGVAYKFILQDSTGASVGMTLDNVNGINDPTVSVSQWTATGVTPTYISTSSFTMPGDVTATMQVGRRVQATVTAGVVYGTIASSAYSGVSLTTTVTMNMDSTGLDSGLTIVNVGYLPSLNTPVPVSLAWIAAQQKQTYRRFTTTGTSTAYVLTPSPSISANTAPIEFEVVFHAGAGTTPTLAVSGLTALPLKYMDGAGNLQPITVTQVPAGWVSPVYTDGTNWIVRSPSPSNVLRGYLDGFILSTAGASATMTIGAGQAADSGTSVIMTLSSAISKTTSAWAVGTGVGGLDTGAIANSTWYYFYAIRRPDTNVVDVIFSANGASPTLPANYTQYRYIGAGLTNGAAQWTRFTQVDDEFYWYTPVQNFSGAGTTTPGALQVVTVPAGRKVLAKLNLKASSGGASEFYVFDPGIDTSAPTWQGQVGMTTNGSANSQAQVWTDTSSQVRHVSFGASGGNISITTIGWKDLRGKNA